MFGKRDIPPDILSSRSIPRGLLELDEANIPSASIPRKSLQENLTIVDLLTQFFLLPSRGQARRLIQQGGIYVNGERVKNSDLVMNESHVQESRIALRIGEKKHCYIIVKN